MLLPANHYPQFSALTTLEELFLQLAKEILEVQKDSSINQNNTSVITITQDDNAETTAITTESWIGSLNDNGIIQVKNLFSEHTFTAGTGDYPFNQNTLVNAFYHVGMYLQRQELSIAKNPGSKQLITFTVDNVAELGATSQLELSMTATDYPITITNNSDQTIVKAKPYLL